MGTLLYEGCEITPQPLQLPPFLMQVGILNGAEPISQVQYDVTFRFVYFDPPRASGGTPFRGHNLMPWARDGLWYHVHSKGAVTGTATPTTAFQYSDFRDLFSVL
jgi:hypothetical protein